MSAATKMNTVESKLNPLFTHWIAFLKTPLEPELLDQVFWKIILVTGGLLLFSFLKASFDAYANNIAQLMAEYSIENSKFLFSWLYSDSLCLILLEVFVLCLWGVVRLAMKYLYDFANEDYTPSIAETFRFLVLGAPLAIVALGLCNWMSRLELPADAPDLIVWLMSFDIIFKVIGPILIIEWARLHIYGNEDDDPAHPEIA